MDTHFNTILHLTHGNIMVDGRIIRELTFLKSHYKDIHFVAIGIGNHKTITDSNLTIMSIPLFSKKIPLIRIFKVPIMYMEWLVRLACRLRRLSPLVIHTHYYQTLLASIIMKSRNSKIIYDAHELESGQTTNRVFSQFILGIEKFSFSRIDFLFTVSPSINQFYSKKFNLSNNKILYNIPTNSNKGRIEKNYFRKKYSIPEESTIFVHSGFLSKNRGIEIILDVFGTIELDAVMIFVGTGEALDLILRHSHYQKNIFVHPMVNPLEVIKTLSSADCGILTLSPDNKNLINALPNKFFEYMHSGLFIISTKNNNIDYALEQYAYGVGIDYDYHQLRIAVRNFILEVPKKEKVYVPSEYSYEAYKETLIKVYNELICVK